MIISVAVRGKKLDYNHLKESFNRLSSSQPPPNDSNNQNYGNNRAATTTTTTTSCGFFREHVISIVKDNAIKSIRIIIPFLLRIIHWMEPHYAKLKKMPAVDSSIYDQALGNPEWARVARRDPQVQVSSRFMLGGDIRDPFGGRNSCSIGPRNFDRARSWPSMDDTTVERNVTQFADLVAINWIPRRSLSLLKLPEIKFFCKIDPKLYQARTHTKYFVDNHCSVEAILAMYCTIYNVVILCIISLPIRRRDPP
jgi:hypothetical protein